MHIFTSAQIFAKGLGPEDQGLEMQATLIFTGALITVSLYPQIELINLTSFLAV